MEKHFQEPSNYGDIFAFQQHLAALISFTTPADEADHPIFLIQYDGDQAWYLSN